MHNLYFKYVFAENILSQTLKLFLTTIWGIIFFPFWWYSVGLISTLGSIFDFVSQCEKDLSFLVWLKNLFVPMYGQNDIAGHLISFFVRLFQVFFRGIGLIFWLGVAFIWLLAWILLPIFIGYQILFQLS